MAWAADDLCGVDPETASLKHYTVDDELVIDGLVWVSPRVGTVSLKFVWYAWRPTCDWTFALR